LNHTSVAKIPHTETKLYRRSAAILRRFSELHISTGGDPTGWLGREDSNLRMAESKSDQFSFCFKAHSEKSRKFNPLSVNRLAGASECKDKRIHADDTTVPARLMRSRRASSSTVYLPLDSAATASIYDAMVRAIARASCSGLPAVNQCWGWPKMPNRYILGT
jgi:hypothetical protein